MHYKNKKTAQKGDLVLFALWSGLIATGHVLRVEPGQVTCNLQIIPVGCAANDCVCATASECVLASDALALFDPAPAPVEPVPASHQDRVRAELSEVRERHRKLGEFIKESPIWESVPDGEQALLREQERAMATYVAVLQARVALFDAVATNVG